MILPDKYLPCSLVNTPHFLTIKGVEVNAGQTASFHCTVNGRKRDNFRLWLQVRAAFIASEVRRDHQHQDRASDLESAVIERLSYQLLFLGYNNTFHSWNHNQTILSV